MTETCYEEKRVIDMDMYEILDAIEELNYKRQEKNEEIDANFIKLHETLLEELIAKWYEKKLESKNKGKLGPISQAKTTIKINGRSFKSSKYDRLVSISKIIFEDVFEKTEKFKVIQKIIQ